jgi:hypothetical protein
MKKNPPAPNPDSRRRNVTSTMRWPLGCRKGSRAVLDPAVSPTTASICSVRSASAFGNAS